MVPMITSSESKETSIACAAGWLVKKPPDRSASEAFFFLFPFLFCDLICVMPREYVLQSFRSPTDLQIDYAGELNEQQQKAVVAPPGPALVIAGAGSGKTRTLTYRVAFLLEQGIPSDRILLLTFTNKAAKEMMRRVKDLLGAELSIFGGEPFILSGRAFFGVTLSYLATGRTLPSSTVRMRMIWSKPASQQPTST